MANVKKKLGMLLSVPLTPDEFEQRALALASTESELRAEEERQDSVKAGLKQAVSDISRKRTMLAEIVSRREELRDIECEDTFDYAAGNVTRVRLDTGEVLLTRPMTPEERQRSMFGEL